MSDAVPTGRRRHRSQRRWSGREELVLQIEWRMLHTYSIGGYIDSEYVTFWRDAHTEDLAVIETAATP